MKIKEGLEKIKNQLSPENIEEVKKGIEKYSKERGALKNINKFWEEATEQQLNRFINESTEQLNYIIPGAETKEPTGKILRIMHLALGRIKGKETVGEGTIKYVKKVIKEGEAIPGEARLGRWYKEIGKRFADKGSLKFLQEKLAGGDKWEEELRKTGRFLVKYLNLKLGPKNFKNTIDEKWFFLWLFEGPMERMDFQRKYREKFGGGITGSFMDHKKEYNEFVGEIDVDVEGIEFDPTHYDQWLHNFTEYIMKNEAGLFFAEVMPELLRRRREEMMENLQKAPIITTLMEKLGIAESEYLQNKMKGSIKEIIKERADDFLESYLGDFEDIFRAGFRRKGRHLPMDKIIFEGEELDETVNKTARDVFKKIVDKVGKFKGGKKPKIAKRAAKGILNRKDETPGTFKKAIRESIKKRFKVALMRAWGKCYKKALYWRYELLDRGIKILGEIALLFTMLVKVWMIENEKEALREVYAP